MANEITTNVTFKATKGYLDITRTSSTQWTLSAAAPNCAGLTQAIGTGAGGEAVDVGDVATLGWAFFRNLDSSNYIEIGLQVSGTFYPLVRLHAGEPALFRLAQGITFYARANTSAAILEKVIVDA